MAEEQPENSCNVVERVYRSQVDLVGAGPEGAQAGSSNLLEVEGRAVAGTGGFPQVVETGHSGFKEKASPIPVEPETEVDIFVIEEIAGVEAVNFEPGVGPDGYRGSRNEADLMAAGSVDFRVTLPNCTGQPPDDSPGIPESRLIETNQDRSTDRSDIVGFEGLGRRIKKTGVNHQIVVHDDEAKAVGRCLQGIDTGVGATPEARVVRSVHQDRTAGKFLRLEIAEVVDDGDVPFDG